MIPYRWQDGDQAVTADKQTQARRFAPLGMLAMVLAVSTFMAAQQVKSQVVGHWVAQNRSEGGLGSMWDFKPDGTLSMSPGAIVDMPYQIQGDKLILPPGTTGPNAKPQIYTFRVEGDVLYERWGEMDKDIKLVRTTKANPGDPPLVGTWQIVFDQNATAKYHMANATFTFTKDGICKLRAAFTVIAGTYTTNGPASGTFTLASRSDQAFSYRVADGKLYLVQPDGKREDVYVREDNE